MLTEDPEIAFLDARHLRNWWSLALPPGVSRDALYALLVLREGQLIHAVISNRGAVDLAEIPFHGIKRQQLTALKRALGVDAIFALERTALPQLASTFERKVAMDDDYPTQGIGLWQALRNSQGIWSEPPLLELIPPLRADALRKTFNLLVPNKSSLAVYIIDENKKRVHCSGIAVKEDGAICLATMHPAIADLVSEQELCRDWRANYSKINRAIESRLAKPSISIFMERSAVIRILTGPADQLAKELKSGTLVIEPSPTWLQGLLGGAAVAAVATAGARRMARFLPQSARKMAGDLAGVAQDRMKNSAVNPFSMLGFDPLQLLQQLRAFYAQKQ